MLPPNQYQDQGIDNQLEKKTFTVLWIFVICLQVNFMNIFRSMVAFVLAIPFTKIYSGKMYSNLTS